jgi:2-polyprenyl-3-methyl-5-hydroxy-6-metoxy-1,4-benzoquinol methylase
MPSLISCLYCPSCNHGLKDSGSNLICSICSKSYPVVDGIPRFVPKENYAESFGLQWNRFASTQIDSKVGTNRSEVRFREETQWDERNLTGKLVLDAGCGSGRFSEIALKLGASLIAVDYSSAVEASKQNLSASDKLIVQGDLAELPILDQTFDYIYCIGVLQHTSEPSIIVKELLRCLKIGGEITLTFYENSSWHVLWYSKYLVRPLTKRLPKALLLKIIEKSSSVWFPLTRFLFSLPGNLSRGFRFLIPIANYVEFKYTSPRIARDEAILDTFDMLSPSYDKPIKKSEIESWISESGIIMQALSIKPMRGTMRFKRVS